MTVISNSSPLILYAAINHLEVLRQLFGNLVIPAAVRDEIMAEGGSRPGAIAIANAPWIVTTSVTIQSALPPLIARVDRGEAEVLALASELSPALVLLDDRAGRRLAHEHGLRVLGSAGIAALARVRGVIPHARPLLDALVSVGLYLRYQEVLRSAGE